MKNRLKVKALGRGSILLSIFFALALTAKSQLTVQSDTTICNGGTATLTATVGVSTSTFQTVSLTDDSYSGVVNIGFPFTFYGNTYTQCVIASNNYITFDLGNAGGYSPWSINSAIPDPGLPTNAIMCPYQDINPSSGGIIEYGTIGTAPNRIFVVRYLGVPMFGATTLEFCSGTFLYEGTNIVETHIANKPLNAAWNGGVAIHGLHGPNGVLADVVPGRNYPTQWTTVNDGYEFIPNGTNAYNVNPIPFQALVSNNNTINWYAGPPPGTFVGTGVSINVSPSVTTDYWAEVQQVCGSGGSGTNLSDTVTVTVANGNAPNITTVDPTCKNANDGMVIIDPQGPNNPWDYNLQNNTGGSVAQLPGATGLDTIGNLGAGGYFLVQTESNGCISNFNVVLQEPDSVSLTVSNDTLICQTGTAMLSAQANDGNGGPYTYVWSHGPVTAGPHAVNPVNDSCFTVYALDQNGCQSATKTTCVTLNPALQVSVTGLDSICPGGASTLTASAAGGSGAGYTFTWDDGTGNIMTGTSITITPAQNTTYCVTLTDDCETPVAQECFTVSIRPLPNVQFTVNPAEGCYPVDAMFTNTTPTADVGSVLWEFGDGNNSTGALVTNNIYQNAGCYDVTLTVTSPAGCVNSATQPGMVCARNYPVADFSYLPDPITIFDPLVQFTNLSTDNQLNDWDIDGMMTTTEVDPKFEFPDDGPGNYPVTLIVTNEFGCTDTVVKEVIVLDEFLLFAPNSFTPDGNGINDFFYVQGGNIDPSDFEMVIFDRWGNLIFEANDPGQAWDGRYQGKYVQDGVYVYRIKARSATVGERYEYYGHVTVVR